MNNQIIYTKDDVVIKKILSTRIKDLTGKHFDKWYVIGYAGNSNDHKSLWWCVCDCDNTKFYKIVGTELSKGRTKSCGCNITISNKQRSFVEQYANSYGLTQKDYDRLHRIYYNMCKRCNNSTDKDYLHYGQRGIHVCKEWVDNEDEFIKWSSNNGYSNELTIERIDVNDDYKPSNCKWITKYQQASNKTTTKYVTYQGSTIKLIDLLNNIGCKTHKEQNKIRCRIFRYGWSVDDAIREYIEHESN